MIDQGETLTLNGTTGLVHEITLAAGPCAGTYHLRLDINTICEAASLGRVNFMAAVSEGAIDFPHMRALLLAAGRGQNGLRTLEQAGLMIGSSGEAFETLLQAFTDAVVAMYPAKADARGNP